ncbi:MAG: hypothetical protein LBD53_03405 [Tannerella sp.]|nr:hypothetical protein [Tannerella sp.]
MQWFQSLQVVWRTQTAQTRAVVLNPASGLENAESPCQAYLNRLFLPLSEGTACEDIANKVGTLSEPRTA